MCSAEAAMLLLALAYSTQSCYRKQQTAKRCPCMPGHTLANLLPPPNTQQHQRQPALRPVAMLPTHICSADKLEGALLTIIPRSYALPHHMTLGQKTMRRANHVCMMQRRSFASEKATAAGLLPPSNHMMHSGMHSCHDSLTRRL